MQTLFFFFFFKTQGPTNNRRGSISPFICGAFKAREQS